MLYLKWVYILLFVLSFTGLFSQEKQDVIKSDKISVINGKKYYLHQVIPGQTVYSICKAYQIEQSELALENPEILEGLKPGQELKIPTVIVKNNQKSTTHTVEKGETLYAISKKYSVTVEQIEKWNPEVKSGLKKDQKLVIYLTTTDPIAEKPNVIEDSNNQKLKSYTHIIREKETLYGISKLYECNLDDILKDNPSKNATNIKAGDTLYIKSKKDYVNLTLVESSDNIYKGNPNDSCISSLLTRAVKVALILPFSEDLHSISKEDAQLDKKPDLIPDPKPFLEYYEGFLMALDSLKKKNIAVDVSVFDSGKDSLTVAELIKSNKLAEMDIVIGPVYQNSYTQMANYCKEKNIWSIYPINSKNADINTNPKVIQINTSLESQMLQGTRFLASISDKRYIIIQNGTNEELNIIKIYKNELHSRFEKNFTNLKIDYHEVAYKTAGLNGVKNTLSSDKVNVLIVTSSNQAFILDLLNKLNGLVKDNKIILATMPQWKKFEKNIEFDHLFNMSATSFDPFFIDYNSPLIKSFESNYYHFFKQSPTKYSYLGYDTGIFFISLFNKYPQCFAQNINKHKVNLLQSTFYFESNQGGFENIGTHIIQCKINEEIRTQEVISIVTDEIKNISVNEIIIK